MQCVWIFIRVSVQHSLRFCHAQVCSTLQEQQSRVIHSNLVNNNIAFWLLFWSDSQSSGNEVWKNVTVFHYKNSN